MEKLKLGVNPLSWMNSDFPSLGSNITVDQCLQEASQIGFIGVELEDPFRKVLDKLPQMLKTNHIRLIGGWHSLHLLENGLDIEKEKLKRHMSLLDSLGGEIVIMAECSGAVHRDPTKSISQRPKLNDLQWGRLCEQLDEMAIYIKENGFRNSYHVHVGTVIQDGKDIEKLVQKTEHVNILFDTGHLMYAKENPLEILNKYIHRINHIHCKDVRASVLKRMLDEDECFYTAVLAGMFTVPGDREDHQAGVNVDYKVIIDKLVDAGYEGWVVMEAEQDPEKAHPYTYASMGYKYLKRLIDDAYNKINQSVEVNSAI